MSGFLAPASRPRFAGIFIMALAVVAYQVLLTRIFSVTLYYHFAFAGISLAMLGLTIGAETVYLKPLRFTPERFEQEWAEAAMGFTISSILLTLMFLCLPFITTVDMTFTLLACFMLLFIIPFTYSGICVTLILTQSAQVGKFYAADLAGAALGCVVIVALLFWLDPVTILFLMGSLTAWSAYAMTRGLHPKLTKISRNAVLILLAAAAVQGTMTMSGHEHFGVFWAKGNWQGDLLFERWNAFSRVRVIDVAPKTPPLGWAYGHPQNTPIRQYHLDIDSEAGTMLTKFDSDLKPFSFLSNDVINMGYHVRPVESVAVIGVGGGRDMMSALYFGAKKIFALELNPSIVEALTETFANFTGHFVTRPEVTLINAEARSWLAQHHPKVDLVQISLIDTWAATAAGGLTLSENRLYTVEAWKEFLGTLNPKGMLAVSRWYDSKDYTGEFYRLLSLAAESLKVRGVPASEIRGHILAFNVGQIVTVVVSPTAFTPAEVRHAYDVSKNEGFKVMVAPDYSVDETSRIIASGQATPEYYDSLPEDLTAPTDNRPFFFFMLRLKDALHTRVVNTYNATNSDAIRVLSILLLGTLVVTGVMVIWPLMKVSDRPPLKAMLADLLYFGGIGLGFMLIEISQMQRLMVFLGHPIYGLSVVLFTLLLFGGLGSATVHPDVRPERLWKRPLLLCLVLCFVGWLTPAFTAQFVAFGTVTRIIVSVMLLAPAGFCMGMMFPTGMIMSIRYREMQPWFWGINGATSVFASILGMAISMQYGIAAAYWSGVAAYGACLLIAYNKRLRVA